MLSLKYKKLTEDKSFTQSPNWRLQKKLIKTFLWKILTYMTNKKKKKTNLSIGENIEEI